MKNNTPPKWKPITRICTQCGIEFIAKNPNTHKCDNCFNKTCPVCGKVFRSWRNQRFCSKECAENRHSIDRPKTQLTCNYCGKNFYPISGHLGQKYCSKECAYKNRRLPQDDHKRQSSKYKSWRRKVFQRDDYTCQKCGATENLQAHHLKEWADYPKLRYSVENGQTLCAHCHSNIHGKPIKPTNTNKLTCDNCGKTIGGRGKTNYCRSCALKLSPIAIAAREKRRTPKSFCCDCGKQISGQGKTGLCGSCCKLLRNRIN